MPSLLGCLPTRTTFYSRTYPLYAIYFFCFFSYEIGYLCMTASYVNSVVSVERGMCVFLTPSFFRALCATWTNLTPMHSYLLLPFVPFSIAIQAEL